MVESMLLGDDGQQSGDKLRQASFLALWDADSGFANCEPTPIQLAPVHMFANLSGRLMHR